MRILHIGNTGGVASTLAYTMDQVYKTDSQVLQPKKNDPYGLTFYGETVKGGRVPYYIRCSACAVKANILHIHAQHEHVSEFRKFGKPLLIHYHGSDIRGQWETKRKQWQNVDRILVSTRELLEGAPSRAQYFPNPVDPMFTPGKLPDRECAVHFSYNADEEAQELADRNGLPLVIVKQRIPHNEIPALLRNYTHLIECKKKNGATIMGSVWDTGSRLSLEALACGLTVICRDGWRKGLPREHRPDYAADRLWRIYQEMAA